MRHGTLVLPPASGGLPTHVFKLSGAPSCYLSRNRRHVRSCRFECLCIAVRLPIRFLLLLRRSLAFDLSLFGLSLFGHVIASPDLLDLWSLECALQNVV